MSGCNWFETQGRFLFGLGGLRAFEFFEAASGFASGTGCPTIYSHSEGIDVLGRDKNNRKFKVTCKSIDEAARIWKEKFSMKKVPRVSNKGLAELKKGYAYFAGIGEEVSHSNLPSIFAVNGWIYVFGSIPKNKYYDVPLKKRCWKIGTAVKIWKRNKLGR